MPVVGVGHIHAIHEIVSVWESRTLDSGVRIVLLTGQGGAGKTLVMQRVYEQLAMRQSYPPYWPRLISGPDAGGGTEIRQTYVQERSERTTIFPRTGNPEVGARPDFFWWGLRGGSSHDYVAFAAGDADRQFDVHLKPIAEAIAAADDVTRKRVAAMVGATFLLASLGALPAAVAAVIQAADNLLDGAKLIRLISKATQTTYKQIEQGLSRNSGTTFDASGRAAAEERLENTAELLKAVSHVLPLCVAIDDAHLLDDVTLNLLQLIVSPANGEAEGLLILAYPERSDPRYVTSPVARWIDALPPSKVTQIALTALSKEELVVFVAGKLPSGPVNKNLVAATIQKSHGSPGRLLDLLQVPVITRALSHDISEESITLLISQAESALGHSHDVLFEQSFEAAPPSAVWAVLLVACHGGISMRRWLITEPTEDVKREPTADVSLYTTTAAISSAIDVGWLITDRRAETVSFTSNSAQRAAVSRLGREIGIEDRSTIVRNLYHRVQRERDGGDWHELDLQLRESVLAVIVDAPDAVPPASRAALLAELATLRRMSGREPGVDLVQAVHDHINSGQPVPTVLAVATAEALFDAGRRENALALLSRQLDEARSRHGSTHPLYLAALHNLAVFFGATARSLGGQLAAVSMWEKSLDLYAELVRKSEDALATSQSEWKKSRAIRMIKIRKQYADLLADSERHFEEAIYHGLKVVKDQQVLLGSEHVETLVSRTDVANWQGEAGDVSRAVAVYEEIVPKLEHQLGKDASISQAARHNFGHWLGLTGQYDRAIDVFELLLIDRRLIWGPDHRYTLNTFAELAHWRGESGDHRGAASDLQQLLADQTRVLGPDDPETLNTRSNLSSWLADLGDFSGAVSICESLLADCIRVFGPDHRRTLAVHSRLAHFAGGAGDPVRAVAEHQRLITRQLRVLGPAHLEILNSRSNLAYWLGEAGDANGAATAHERLLADRRRILSSDHPDILVSLTNLSHWRAAAGDARGAAEAYEELLDQQRRIMGPNDLQTLMTWSMFAYWEGTAGGPSKAVGIYEQLLSHQTDVLGPEHTMTLTTRRDLAYWRGMAGNQDEAIVEFEQLLPDLVKYVGAEHPVTRTARHDAAYWKREPGEPTVAVGDFERLLTDLIKILGRHHPYTLMAANSLAYWQHRCRDNSERFEED